MTELDELLRIASQAARSAGQALRTKRAAWSGIVEELGREVKVDADKRAEDLILASLARLAPYPIISEEAGLIGAAGSARVWAVDPLDGSVNYVQGYPHCAVSIALLEQGVPVLGVVDAFLMDEAFTGIVGVGARRNGEAMNVSEVRDPQRGILNTGIPARARTDPAAMQALMLDLLAWRKVRMIGSAAMALAYVADGRADAYRESGSMIWDVAGGCALVLAAGGRVDLSAGALDQPRDVLARNATINWPMDEAR